jgi:hypothetical protein
MKRGWIASYALAAVLGSGTAVCSGQAMEHHDEKPAVPSKTLTITANGKSTTLTLADIQAMPQHTLKVHNGHNNQDEVYTGVAMSDLLAKYGISLTDAHKVYHSYVKAQGTDKYWVLYSASELEPDLATWESMVAITMDGKPLAEDGAFKIIAGGERRPARWVRNLSSLTIVTLP